MCVFNGSSVKNVLLAEISIRFQLICSQEYCIVVKPAANRTIVSLFKNVEFGPPQK